MTEGGADIREETVERRRTSSILRERLLRSAASASPRSDARSDRRGATPGGAREGSQARIRFSNATRELLALLFEEIPAERGFFLIRSRVEASERSGEPLRVVVALRRDLRPIPDPDYALDHHYLREISGVDGARILPGAEAGGVRPLLTCAVELAASTRGIAVLDAAPGRNPFPPASRAILEEWMAEVLLDLRWLYTIELQEEELAELRRELTETEKQLELRELELGGVRTMLEQEPAPGVDATRYHQIVTRSPRIQSLFKIIDRIKDTDLSTLIYGETGTGKEVFARAIHFGGNRSPHPFEVVPCGALSPTLLESELFGYRKGAFSGADSDRKGIFERANGGTVFLDEVTDMTADMQKKILRVLQEQVIRPIGAEEPVRVNVRVIASTQHDLEEAVRKNRFREDLFYRLNVITVEVPPLRDHREDIPLLVAHFLAQLEEEEELERRFSDSAMRELYQYSWPGNVQELRNVVTRAYLLSTRRVISRSVVVPLLSRSAGGSLAGDGLTQDGDNLTLTIPYSVGFKNLIEECEKLILLSALKRNRGNKSRVTEQLKIPRQTLYNKLEQYGFVASDYRGGGSYASEEDPAS